MDKEQDNPMDVVAHLMANQPDPVIIDVTQGIEHVEERITELEAQSANDPEWAQNHIICLNVPGVEDKYCGKLLPMCCVEHTKTVAKSLLQAIALGWVEAWQDMGRSAVDVIFADKTLALREKQGLLGMASEYFKAGAMERLDKEGWADLIERSHSQQGAH